MDIVAPVALADLPKLVQALRLGETGRGRRVRERSGISVRQLALALGVNQADLSRWERGLSRPRSVSALRWLEAVETLDAATPPDDPEGTTSDLPNQIAPVIAPGDPQRGTARDAR